MTSYNRAHYIGQALDSILEQVCDFPIEIIIGDNCSEDGSRELLQGYKTKYPDVIVLNFQKINIGFGPNWASCCKLARGKYIAFCDDDDYWCDSHRLQEMVTKMEEDERIGLVYTNRYTLDVANDIKVVSNAHLPEGENKVDYMMHKGFPILFSASMIRKSLMDQYVNLEDYIRLSFPIQDWPTAMLLAPHCEFCYMEKPSAVYRSYVGSMSKPRQYEQLIERYNRDKVMYQYVSGQLSLQFDEAGWERYVNHLLLALAYQRGDYKEAKRYAILSGDKSIKAKCTETRLLFWMYKWLQVMKRKFKKQ
jgi:glycosyltransferase involved in cell wall biosynthesis